MPGGFHPFHAGHLALYDSAREAFPGAEVFVAATNDTSSRPFPFAVKEKLAKLAGVAPGHFVQVRSPFRAEEITSKFDPDRDRLIFVRSEKDAAKPPQAGGVKRDGSAAYLQPLAGQTNIRPFKEHAYMAYLPTVEFGPGMTSATEIRTAWPTLNEKRKTALVMSLYPRTQSNPKLAATVVGLLDAAIGGEQGMAEGKEKNHWYDAGVKDATRGASPNPRTYLPTLKDKQAKHPEEVDFYMNGYKSVNQDVAEGAEEAEKYRAQLLKTAPRVMDFLAKTVKGWRPSEQEMLGAIDTAYMVMKHTGDIKQAGKAMVDELNTLHRMSQGQSGMTENFADGRNPQDKGDAKRHGINTKASVSSLRKTAKQGGRKGQLAHWLANMKAGRAKNENADSDYIEEKWSSEYKSSINCTDPKGFSQKAHCAGRKK